MALTSKRLDSIITVMPPAWSPKVNFKPVIEISKNYGCLAKAEVEALSSALTPLN